MKREGFSGECAVKLPAEGVKKEEMRLFPEKLDAMRFSFLDRDLQILAFKEMKIHWTYGSTGIEGNTMSLGDTAFLIQEGLTVAGKSLKEHNEVVGHARGVDLLEDLARKRCVEKEDLFCLHRAVQTNVVRDTFSPLGAFKVEPNGCYVRHDDGTWDFHTYPAPEKVPFLMEVWMNMLNAFLGKKETPSLDSLVLQQAKCHIGFVSIHPFADGNGRMARLFANLPLVAQGIIPILIFREDRKRYIDLLAAYQEETKEPGISSLVPENDALEAFTGFLWDSLRKSWEIMAPLFALQEERNRKR